MFNIIVIFTLLFNCNSYTSTYQGSFVDYNKGEVVYCYNVDDNYFNCYDEFTQLVTFEKRQTIDLSGEGYCDYWVARNNTIDKYIIFNCNELNNDNIQGWVVFTKRDITP